MLYQGFMPYIAGFASSVAHRLTLEILRPST
jgi:hypothetical protein